MHIISVYVASSSIAAQYCFLAINSYNLSKIYLKSYQNVVAECFQKIIDHLRLENIDNYKLCQEKRSIIYTYLQKTSCLATGHVTNYELILSIDSPLVVDDYNQISLSFLL